MKKIFTILVMVVSASAFAGGAGVGFEFERERGNNAPHTFENTISIRSEEHTSELQSH